MYTTGRASSDSHFLSHTRNRSLATATVSYTKLEESEDDDSSLQEDAFEPLHEATELPPYKPTRFTWPSSLFLNYVVASAVGLLLLLALGQIYLDESVCRSPLLDRNSGTFWRVDISLPNITISPRHRSSWHRCNSLQQLALLDGLQEATFTTRLHFENETRVLTDPVQTRPAEYTFTVLAPLRRHIDPTVEVEATLELAWYSGAGSGMPCAGASDCRFEDVAQRGVKWSGERIFDGQGQTPTYTNLEPALLGEKVEEDLPICDDFTVLSGSWIQNSTYLPLDSNGQPCRLLPVNPPGLTDAPTRIRFVGDSNMRYLFTNFAPLVGATNCAKSPRHRVCWGPNVIVVWSFWFHSLPSPPGLAYSALKNIFPIPLSDYLLDPTLVADNNGTWPSYPSANEVTGGFNRTYFSLGSHAPAGSTRATREVWQELTPLLLDPTLYPTLRLFKTSAVDTAWLVSNPKWRHQITLENNPHIALINDVTVKVGQHLRVPVLDVFEPVRAAIPFTQDAVHQKSDMYKNVWSRMVQTDVHGEMAYPMIEGKATAEDIGVTLATALLKATGVMVKRRQSLDEDEVW